MNELLGQVFTGLIIDENEKMYLVQKNGVTFQLLKDEGETHEVGESVEGFAYVNQKRDAIFTTKIPRALCFWRSYGCSSRFRCVREYWIS